jgi:homoserine O-succinyltransferase
MNSHPLRDGLFFSKFREGNTMPIKIPHGLPARQILEAEGVPVIPEERAFRQDIRPLQILVLNLMPLKPVTETQLLRLLGSSPLQVSVTFLRLSSHRSKNTPPEHLKKFYKDFAEVARSKFDCLIVTGAPVETLPFTQVGYWDELRTVLDWSITNVFSSLHICWGAQAALYHWYKVEKYPLSEKLSGIFLHKTLERQHPLVRGFDSTFAAPHSRYTEVRSEDVVKTHGLRLLAESDAAGAYLAASENRRLVFVTGHPEYDLLTLKEEFARDSAKGLPVPVPTNYFPGNDPSGEPVASWCAHANLLFSNWINDVYQHAPFDLNELTPP